MLHHYKLRASSFCGLLVGQWNLEENVLNYGDIFNLFLGELEGFQGEEVSFWEFMKEGNFQTRWNFLEM